MINYVSIETNLNLQLHSLSEQSKMAPVTKKKKDTIKKILKYDDSKMQAAIVAVRDGGCKIRKAARDFGVPHSTLINKLKGRVPEVRKMGRDSYLTSQEEAILCKYIIANAKKGIPLKRRTLKETVQKIIEEDQRKTPFKNNCPGDKWFDLFLKRHPEVTERNAESINKARATVTEDGLRSWFTGLKEHLDSENASDILLSPERIFNADESGFQTCPKSGKVLGPVGLKDFYEIKSGQEKELITVMANFSAVGTIVPPMIVYPLARISREIANNVPNTWGIGRTKKGWMTGPLYYEYIANCFNPWLEKSGIQKPVLLLIDGHRSHLTLLVSKFCEENKIIAYALFPNSTHIIQPADVAIFKPMKNAWREIVYDYKKKSHNKAITRASIAPLLEIILEEYITIDMICNGFRKCGIYPFNPTAVDFTKCMTHVSRKENSRPTTFGVEHLLLLESLMKTGRVEEFRRAENEDWTGDETATELFTLWKKVRSICTAASSSKEAQSEENNDARVTSHTQTTENEIDLRPTQSIEDHTDDVVPTQPNAEIIMNAAFAQPTEVPTVDAVPARPGAAPAQPTENPIVVAVPTPLGAEPTQRGDNICNDHFLNISCKTPPHVPVNAESTIRQSTTFGVESTSHTPQLNISPAFMNHLIWPSDSPVKTQGRRVEKLPYATTSKKWQEHWEKKEYDKKKKLIERDLRLKIKLEKQKILKKKDTRKNPKKRKAPSSSDSETEKDIENIFDNKNIPKTKYARNNPSQRKTIPSSSDTETDQDRDNFMDVLKMPTNTAVNQGDFVLVAFPSDKCSFHYVCIVQKTFNDDDVEVMAMKTCDEENTTFRTNDEDVSLIKKGQIITKLHSPNIILQGDRIKYKFAQSIDVGKKNMFIL